MAFTFAACCYILALILTAILIFFVIYQIISFDELKTDYKNPIDQCKSLNPLVLPEYLLHGLFNILFLAAGEWITVVLNAPLIAYHVNRYLNRPVMSGPGLYDPTTIMNADELNRGQKEGWIKLAFYIISFFYYLYRHKEANMVTKCPLKLESCKFSGIHELCRHCFQHDLRPSFLLEISTRINCGLSSTIKNSPSNDEASTKLTFEC